MAKFGFYTPKNIGKVVWVIYVEKKFDELHEYTHLAIFLDTQNYHKLGNLDIFYHIRINMVPESEFFYKIGLR